jgi:nitroreductase
MLDLIQSRRSIRKYTSEPIADADIQAMLEAAMAAPSANNVKPWEFVVVRDRELCRKLADTHTYSKMAADAAAVFVICGREGESRHWVEDTSAATQNLLLAAAGLGLGAVWVACYPSVEREGYVRELLGLPASLRVLCLVPAGHPAESKAPRTQFDPGRVHYDRYQ